MTTSSGTEALGDAKSSSIFERSLVGLPADPETLRALHGRVPLHLVSGMPEDELTAVLAQRGLTPFFASVAGAPKHKREVFRRILDVGGLAAEEALALGDSTTEFEAARDLGIPFFAIVAEGTPDFFPPDVPRLDDLSGFPALVAR
ncbi:HAD family hydrolase [Ancylobacter aquaticus]|uniref:HAD family hydrolase n=1 Tax=Ancylobacter aquaticus TaxID=100 RepID=UPI001FDF2204|nr:HAD family hydrolase [Ancylobacter aquaticus]